MHGIIKDCSKDSKEYIRLFFVFCLSFLRLLLVLSLFCSCTINYKYVGFNYLD